MSEITRTAVRKPSYAYHEIRPDGGLPLTQWAIERQLSLASDYAEADLIDVLLAMNPDLDESITADIEKLLDLGDLAYTLDMNGRVAEYHAAVDEYCEQLRKLARLVRGLPIAPTRPRNVLGAVSS